MEENTQTPISDRLIPVILAGGIGERLWPLSTPDHPKPFHTFGHETSLFLKTLERVQDQSLFHPPIIIAQVRHRPLVLQALEAWKGPPPHLIWEPDGRNTAPPLLCALLLAQAEYKDGILAVLPSDHHIEKRDHLHTLFSKSRALKDHLLTFGIVPTAPETGYGYIQKGLPLPAIEGLQDPFFKIASFIEKPNHDRALELLNTQNTLWNSGMFILPLALTHAECIRHCPALLNQVEAAWNAAFHRGHEHEIPGLLWSEIEGTSIDHALFEHTTRAAVLEVNLGWSDLGTWESLWKSETHDKNGTACIGPAQVIDVTESYIYTENGLKTAVFGVENIIIVHVKDTVLVLSKPQSQHLSRFLRTTTKDSQCPSS